MLLRLRQYFPQSRVRQCEPAPLAAHPPNSIRDISRTALSSNARTSIAKIVPAIATPRAFSSSATAAACPGSSSAATVTCGVKGMSGRAIGAS